MPVVGEQVMYPDVPATLTTPVADDSKAAQLVPSTVPSNTDDWPLNQIVPAAPAREAVLPCGNVTPPVPGNTKLFASPIVTAPVAPDTVV